MSVMLPERHCIFDIVCVLVRVAFPPTTVYTKPRFTPTTVRTKPRFAPTTAYTKPQLALYAKPRFAPATVYTNHTAVHQTNSCFAAGCLLLLLGGLLLLLLLLLLLCSCFAAACCLLLLLLRCCCCCFCRCFAASRLREHKYPCGRQVSAKRSRCETLVAPMTFHVLTGAGPSPS